MSSIISHPSVILIIGRRRFGKSALGYHILEKFHKQHPELKIFVVSLPKEKHHLLPDWITPVDIVEDLPDNCVALVDEGAMKYHAHKWNKKETEVMDTMISISGQRHQTFIFITHTMRKFAVTLLLDINILLCKKPSLLHSKLERSEFRKLVEEVDREFNKLPKDDVKKSVYVLSDDFKGFIRNPLPSFWSEDLSEAYAGVDINGKKEEKKEEEIVLPARIEEGLKLWFKKEDKTKVLHILSKNSTIDGELHPLGVQCSADKCFYSFDLKRNNGKYVLSDKWDLEKSLAEFEEKDISVVVDVETAFPLSIEDVVFKQMKKEEKKKDKLKDYAEKIKL